MFEKAVIASSARGSSRDAESEMRTLRGLGVREVVLTHAVDVFDDASESWRLQADAEDAFVTEMTALEAGNFRVHADVPLGHPAKLLGEMSTEHHAKLIVLDAGSVALSGALCPDGGYDTLSLGETPILVRPQNPARVGSRCIGERVLFATDFSQTAARAFVTLVGLTRACHSRVDLLHVCESDACADWSAPAVVESDRRPALRLARLKERLLSEGAEDVSIDVVDGVPAEEISKRSLSSCYTLIVMGSRGMSSTADGVLGAVSGLVAQDAIVHLLLVPPARATVRAIA